nr:putative 1,4-alpha-glucan branching protein GlgB [uncultured bacterium]
MTVDKNTKTAKTTASTKSTGSDAVKSAQQASDAATSKAGEPETPKASATKKTSAARKTPAAKKTVAQKNSSVKKTTAKKPAASNTSPPTQSATKAAAVSPDAAKVAADKSADSGPSLSGPEIEAIVGGRYEDIFAVLGLHNHPAGKGLVLRVFLPQASSVDAIGQDGAVVASLQKISPAGLFEAQLPDRTDRFSYRLKLNGDQIVDDPYRFSSLLSNDDLYLFNEGTHEHNYRWMGANPRTVDNVEGVSFTVWAPSAKRVSLVGEFNNWDGRCHIMRRHPAAGVWEIFIPGLQQFTLYKYEIIDGHGQLLPLKSDPYARSMQHPPETASRVVLNDDFSWSDSDWMNERAEVDHYVKPISIYELHAGSWRRKFDEDNRYLSYHELADELIPYVLDMGFTHVQLMPVSEYPFDGSWGYQPVGMFAPSIRFGTPDEFRYFVNRCHQANIGVMLDWVPGHFPTDAHGLGRFDGSCLYEHQDTRQGYHPDWNTLIYNYGRSEVVSFLLSNANYWLEEFHIDGLRVDAVASMLYLDYSRDEGEWIPNQYGGRENLEAIRFLQTVNSRVRKNHPGVLMIAEESTAWPGVSRKVEDGGLGFNFKWNMGWMNDSLGYIERDPIYRSHHHDEMTFSIVYAWDENFVLSLSHDEVVHGKGSMLAKMPGDDWQKFANLRAYYGFMWGHPGKKLVFQGCEFAQREEWNHDQSLDWHLLSAPWHNGVRMLVRDLNTAYAEIPALCERDCSPEGFQWLQLNNREISVFAWARWARNGESLAIVICNLTPQPHFEYMLGVPKEGWYKECINSDAKDYGGSGNGNSGGATAVVQDYDGQPYAMSITVPPLSTLIFEYQG